MKMIPGDVGWGTDCARINATDRASAFPKLGPKLC